MKRFLLPVLVAVVPVYMTACGDGGEKSPDPVKPAAEVSKKVQSPENVIAENKGNVVVLLMGMEGCSGTAKATRYLTEYSQSKPSDVEVYRVDVPPPGQTLKAASGLDSRLNYMVDNSRFLAEKFDFFFYPTLYILDKAGTVRFHGECDGEKVEKMVAEIRSEKPGAVKKMYTPKLPDIGTTAVNFTGKSLDGAETNLKKISSGASASLLLFSKTTCPFSNKAVESLARLKGEFEGGKLSVTVINMGQSNDTIKEFYASKAPDTRVIVDTDESISKGGFGVSAVPFFYVLDSDMKIVERKPYTEVLAKASIAQALGIQSAGCESSSGAG